MSQVFSETLRKLRNEKKLSQQALADKVFVTRSTVARWVYSEQALGRAACECMRGSALFFMHARRSPRRMALKQVFGFASTRRDDRHGKA